MSEDRYASVVANDHVNLKVKRGEILALLGENGSGKTTLMNMISGIYHPDEGTIYINGEETVINSPTDAAALGIGMIHQHFKLVEVHNAMDNIILGTKGKGLNRKDLKKKIVSIWMVAASMICFLFMIITELFSRGLLIMPSAF